MRRCFFFASFISICQLCIFNRTASLPLSIVHCLWRCSNRRNDKRVEKQQNVHKDWVLLQCGCGGFLSTETKQSEEVNKLFVFSLHLSATENEKIRFFIVEIIFFFYWQSTHFCRQNDSLFQLCVEERKTDHKIVFSVIFVRRYLHRKTSIN